VTVLRRWVYVFSALLFLANTALLLEALGLRPRVGASVRPSSGPAGFGATEARARPRAKGAWPVSQPPCEVELALAAARLRRLQQLAANHLPLRYAYERETAENPSLGRELATVLDGAGIAPGMVASHCRGRICRMLLTDNRAYPLVLDQFRSQPWVKSRSAEVGTATLQGRAAIFVRVSDPDVDPSTFLTRFWNDFLRSDVPSQCQARDAPGREMKVALEITEPDLASGSDSTMTASYYVPKGPNDYTACVSGVLETKIRATAVPAMLMPGMIINMLPAPPPLGGAGAGPRRRI
jgi:hypothetical protein